LILLKIFWYLKIKIVRLPRNFLLTSLRDFQTKTLYFFMHQYTKTYTMHVKAGV